MSGDAVNWGAEKIRSYQKRGGAEVKTGVFTVAFEIDGNRATVKLTLDFAGGEAKYNTTYKSGNRDGFSPPRPLRRFMTPGFVRFFIFDGELAENLLDSSETDAERAIEDLFQMRLLDTIKSRVEDYWRDKTSDQRVSRKNALNRHIDKYQRSKSRLKEVRKQKAQDQEKLDKKRDELRRKEEQFEDELRKKDNSQEKRTQAKGQLEYWQGRVETLVANVLDNMRNPHALSDTFADEIIHLKERLDKVQLPERTAREFFEELAAEDECICGPGA